MPVALSPSKLVFQHDVRISRPEQDRARRNLCLRLKEKGWTALGIEFLFVDEKEMAPGPEMRKRLIDWRDFMNANFNPTCFSVHAPWMPIDSIFLFGPSPLVDWLLAFQRLGLDFIDCINVHPGHPTAAFFSRHWNSPALRQKALHAIASSLASLPGKPNIAIENILPARGGQDYVAFVGCLPSHLAFWVDRVHGLGWTLDTAHAGITIDACRTMVANQRLEGGFFEEDWPEIHRVGEKGLGAFLDIPHLGHVHLANWGESDDAWDGFELDRGKIGLDDYRKVLACAQNTKGGLFGVNLEINERDYLNPVAVERSLEWIRQNAPGPPK